MAEPRGTFGEVPSEALVLSFWGMEGFGGLRESQVMGADFPLMGCVSLPLHLFWFEILSPSLAPFLQIRGFPLETLGAEFPVGSGMRKCQDGPVGTMPRAALQGITLAQGCSQLSGKQLLLEPQPRARGPARVWVEYLGKPCFLSFLDLTFLTFNKWVVSGWFWETLVPRRT